MDSQSFTRRKITEMSLSEPREHLDDGFRVWLVLGSIEGQGVGHSDPQGILPT